MFKNNKNYKKGFSLVETLVAVAILSLSIAATMTAVQKGIQSSGYAKDQITAFYLAQEGMEFIKNIRDENALQSLNDPGISWLRGLSDQAGDPCYFGKICTIDSNLKHITDCPDGTGTCPVLNIDPATGLMGYTSDWTPTTFNREIEFRQISNNPGSFDEVSVIIRMRWVSHGINKSFEISENLFNRQ